MSRRGKQHIEEVSKWPRCKNKLENKPFPNWWRPKQIQFCIKEGKCVRLDNGVISVLICFVATEILDDIGMVVKVVLFHRDAILDLTSSHPIRR